LPERMTLIEFSALVRKAVNCKAVCHGLIFSRPLVQSVSSGAYLTRLIRCRRTSDLRVYFVPQVRHDRI
jgi:hypothetical protein